MKFKNLLNLFIGKKSVLVSGLAILILMLGTYNFYQKTTKLLYYRVFDFSKTFSWERKEDGYYRKDSFGNLDTTLITTDDWQNFQLDFQMWNCRSCGVMFARKDTNNFRFIYLRGTEKIIVLGETVNGKTSFISTVPYNFPERSICHVEGNEKSIKFTIDNRTVLESPVDDLSGKLGLIIDEARIPKTIFNDVSLSGKLLTGETIDSGHASWINKFNFLIAVVVLLGALFILSVYLANLLKQSFDLKVRAGAWIIIAVHLFSTIVLFWPFLSSGQILVSSSDNNGQIFPLMFHCRHIFWDLLQGQSLSLWNPYLHNGVPFYTNHWNMIYYPFNWIVFLFPESQMMNVITIKTMIEVFLIGILAYGFLKLELGSRRWALFGSVVYQLNSLLIFTLTIFPCITLLFAMTLYLYVLWSMPQRKSIWNYLALTFTGILILTSANVAFTFYAALSLFCITIYRFYSLTTNSKEKKGHIKILSLAVVTAFLICSVRIIPCLLGILDSNRIVDNFYTLHDRESMILRFFLPEITGWVGSDSFNALTSKNLNLMFEQLDMPSNSQNTFFAYFGIIPAILLFLGVFIRGEGKLRFWKIYAWSTIAIGLLFQPVWGLFSILFFPLNHYSYHLIILPVGVTVWITSLAMGLENKSIPIDGLGKKVIGSLIFIQSFILVFVTYLYPPLENYSRMLIFLAILWTAIYFVFKKGEGQSENLKRFLSMTKLVGIVILSALVIIGSTLLLLNPLVNKTYYGPQVAVPLVLLLSVVAMALGFLTQEGQVSKFIKENRVKLGLGLALILFVACGVVASSYFERLLYIDRPILVYIIDLVMGELKFLLLAFIGFILFSLWRQKFINSNMLVGLVVVLTVLDLLAFNKRFDAVVAPTPVRTAFIPGNKTYKDINPQLRAQLDLINYRADRFREVSLSDNRALIFKIPSYSGIVGYMPKRFSKFISHFGYSDKQILIYPQDASNNERFLDLSAVKNRFQNENSFEIRPTALALLNFYSTYDVIDNDEALLRRLEDPAFDPHRTVLLSEQPDALIEASDDLAQFVPIQRSHNDMVGTRIVTSSEGIVLFTNSFDEGWKAFVDGKPTQIFRANYNFLACFVPAGSHDVEFIYKPKRYFQTLYISTLGICFMLFISLLLSSRKLKF